MKQLIIQLAEKLDTATRNSQAIEMLSITNSISLSDAYNIQNKSIERRYERGETLTGIKLGFTSKAKMIQMGVHDLIWGRLTNTMEIKNGDFLDLAKFIHPRAEPEIAFLLKKDIEGLITLIDAENYIEAIAPAIEIIDSRYENFKFSLEDVVADNCSSAAYVVGEWIKSNLDISDLNLSFTINNELVQSGNSSAILGNPLLSLVEAVRLANEQGEVLKKGMVILAGAVTSAEFINKDDIIEASFEKLGKVTLKA